MANMGYCLDRGQGAFGAVGKFGRKQFAVPLAFDYFIHHGI
jgi:hypothetical protein